ncbi:hypothetical protein FB451DRAFT_1172128 [Mycena latifolia]|nr:hypothetical protein FB451DRAFT_1172128 [Mycena latifolia]
MVDSSGRHPSPIISIAMQGQSPNQSSKRRRTTGCESGSQEDRREKKAHMRDITFARPREIQEIEYSKREKRHGAERVKFRSCGDDYPEISNQNCDDGRIHMALQAYRSKIVPSFRCNSRIEDSQRVADKVADGNAGIEAKGGIVWMNGFGTVVGPGWSPPANLARRSSRNTASSPVLPTATPTARGVDRPSGMARSISKGCGRKAAPLCSYMRCKMHYVLDKGDCASKGTPDRSAARQAAVWTASQSHCCTNPEIA